MQPGIGIIIDGDLFGIDLAVSLMGATEKDLAADHTHQGTVAENIVGILWLVSAYYRHPSGHELSEIIAGTAQNPEFRWIETGVVFGHRHPPGADISLDANLTLGHGIGHAVTRIAVNGDMGPGI